MTRLHLEGDDGSNRYEWRYISSRLASQFFVDRTDVHDLAPALVAHPREHERPLDAREARAFEDIVAAFGELPAATSAVTPPAEPVAVPPAPPGGRRPPLTWRQTLLVLAVAVVVAALTAVLPTPLNLWAPVVLFAVIALGCVVWGRRQESGRPG